MKSVLVALLFVAVLLLVATEAKRRGGKGKPDGGRKPGQKKIKECPSNCSDCEEGICRECDDDFVLKTRSSRRFNKTICVPCEGPGRRGLRKKNPAGFLLECVTECPKNCSSCGDNGNCETCDDGFFKVQTRLLQRTICVPCSKKMKKKWPEVYKKECRPDACGKNCTNCTMDGVCTECEGDLKLLTSPGGSNFTKCVNKCPLFYKLEEGSSPARCELKQSKPAKRKCGKNCEKCSETGACEKCKDGLVRIRLLGKYSACRNRCPSPFKSAKICDRRDKKLRKEEKKNVTADLP